MRLMRFIVVAILVAAPASAGPFTVEVLTTQYKTALTVNATHRIYDDDGGYVTNPVNLSRTRTSSAPIADSIAFNGPEVWGQGIAGAFSAAASTDTTDLTFEYYGRSNAWAESVIHFSPAQTGTAAIGLDAMAYSQWQYTNGAATLLDLTTNTGVWDYSWAYRSGAGNMPWDSLSGSLASASFITPTELIAGHVYVMTLFTHSNSAQDSQGASLTVSGLQTVPEPSGLVLLATAGIAAGLRRQRLRRMRTK